MIATRTELEVVRGAFEAMERGDADKWLAHVAPDIRIQRPCGAIAIGLDAALRLAEDPRTRTTKLIDLTPVHDWVVAAGRRPQGGGESGEATEESTALAVCRVRDGLIVSVHFIG